MPTKPSPAPSLPTLPEDCWSLVASTLTAIREEWEQRVKPMNLLQAPASIGLILIDIVAKLNFGPVDADAILGTQLYQAFRKRWHSNR